MHMADTLAVQSRWCTGDVEKLSAKNRGLLLSDYSAYLWEKKRADERTRTAYPCSLRVITQALQGCAGGCKCRIYKRLSLLWLAGCCTVLRSRWYQSGIKIALYSACTDGDP